MSGTSCRRRSAGVIVFLAAGLSLAAFAREGTSLKEILARNIQASGGQATLGRIRNFGFKAGGMRNVVSAAGELKVISGKEPAVTGLVLIKGESVRKKSFNAISDITSNEKRVYQTLAKLYAGLFSLGKFNGQLAFVGLKSFGPEKLYHLALKSQPGGLAIGFFLREDDFTLKRLVFQGQTPEGDKYEVNYDFAPFEESQGLKIPLSWFISQVGTRGNLAEVSEVKTNEPLAKDFFKTLEINVGTASAGPGVMKGSVLDINSSPFGLIILTNWTKKDVEKAGLQTGDKLIMSAAGLEFELAFFASAADIPAANKLPTGARFLSPDPRGGETLSIQFMGGENASLAGQLKPLTDISVKRIS